MPCWTINMKKLLSVLLLIPAFVLAQTNNYNILDVPLGGVITAGGPTGSATVAPIITYNAAGQLTTVTSATITPAVGSVTGLGTGIATALGANVSGSGGMLLATTPALVA